MSLEQIDKEAKAQELEQKINQIKSSLSTDKSAIRELYSKTSPKKDLLNLWAEYLEELTKLGRYNKPIFTICETITSEMKEMGLPYSYIRKVLPFKYKNPDKNTSSGGEESCDTNYRKTSSLIRQHRKANKDFVKLIRSTAEFLDSFADSIRDIEFIEKLEPMDYQFMLKRHEFFLNLCKEATDRRTQVLPSTQFMFIEAFQLGGMQYCFEVYIKYVKQYAELTGKQARKILYGKTEKIMPIFDPHTRTEALQSGFYGMPCEKCGGWRVDLLYHSGIGERLHCYKCSHEWIPIAEKLPHKALRKKD